MLTPANGPPRATRPQTLLELDRLTRKMLIATGQADLLANGTDAEPAASIAPLFLAWAPPPTVPADSAKDSAANEAAEPLQQAIRHSRYQFRRF